MSEMKDRQFRWLVVGALGGAAVVVVVTLILRLPIESWIGALIPTLSAVISAGVGPRIFNNPTPAPAAQ